jgi:hypothetical protein
MPTGTTVHLVAAGTCTIRASQGGNTSYNAAPNVDQSFTIAKATATINVNGFTGPYDGNPHGATGTATGVGGANLNASLDLGATFTDVPGGTAHWTFAGNPNYNDASGDVTITITKATATINVNGFMGPYDGNPHGATGTATGVGGVNLNASLDLGATFTDVPGGTAHWTFNGGTNYSDASGDVLIVITKADATISVNGFTGVYDGNPHGATGTATGVGGANLNAGLNLGATFTDVPGGTANWNFNGGTNYNNAGGNVPIVITKADATISVNGFTGVYDGNPHGATGTAAGVGGANLNASLNLGATFTDVPGGTANWHFNGGTNYNNASGNVAIVISKATATININGYTGVYDANPHGATGTATGVSGANLNAGLNLGATFTDVPGGTANWNFNGGTNYNNASGNVAIVITKATATISVNGHTGVYDGNPHGATGAATGVGGVNLNASLNLGTSYTNVPGGTANWTFNGGTNYFSNSGNVAIVITQATPTIAWSNPAFIISGTALSGTQLNATASGVAGSLPGTFSYSPAAGTVLGVGPHLLGAVFTPVDSLNYTNAAKSVTISVLYQLSGVPCLGEAGHQIRQPIDADGTSVFKQGSTVPAKFRVCDVNGVSIGTPGVVSSFRMIGYWTGTFVDVPDEAVVSTTPDTAFRWSATDQQWIFNMSTKPLQTGRTYVYQITLNDGSTIDFRFGLR